MSYFPYVAGMNMTDWDCVNHRSFVEPEPQIHSPCVMMQHWQLRDLMHTDQDDNLVFCSKNTIAKYNPDSKQTKTLLEVGYSVNTLHVHKENIAFGGNEGRFGIISPAGTYKGTVGKSINNDVKIADLKGSTALMACNNDCKLRFVDLETGRTTYTLHHTIPVNCCDISPNGKSVTAVTDQDLAFTFHLDESPKKYEVRETIRDAAFSVGYNRDGSRFCIGTQDGYICVYDSRYEEIKYIIDVNHGVGGNASVRKVAFTKDFFVDLLLYTTQEGHFGLLDAREKVTASMEYQNRQNIKITSNKKPISITGSTFSKDKNSLYIATPYNILEYKIKTRNMFFFETAEQS